MGILKKNSENSNFLGHITDNIKARDIYCLSQPYVLG